MIDGINAIIKIPKTHGLAYLPCWEFCVNKFTGEQSKDKTETAKLRNMDLLLKPTKDGKNNFIMKGSLHRWHNAGAGNSDLFMMEDVKTAINSLGYILEIEPSELKLQGVEFGVNIPLPYSPKTILDNLVSYKGKGITNIDKRVSGNGVLVWLNDYELKIYDKGKIGKVDDQHILRIEIKVTKMRHLERFGITTLADLSDTDKVHAASELLHDAIGSLMFTDNTTNLNLMTDREQKQWLRLTNPMTWKDRHTDKMAALRSKRQLQTLIDKYANMDYKKELSGRFEAIRETMFLGSEKPNEAYKMLPFHSIGKERKGNNIDNSNIIKSPEQPQKKRVCCSCGSDISHQKTGSRFCSASFVGEKKARQCRNKESNIRRKKKRTIDRAKKNDLLLKVSYLHDGTRIKTAIIKHSDLIINRNWLDRIVTISVVPKARSG